ncbi:MAG: transporter substrate-binding domain-containing protein [Spirochaetia bacterium]
MRHFIHLFALFFLFTALAAPVLSDKIADKIVLNTADTPPLSNREDTGFLDLILEEAFARIDRSIKIIHLPSQRSILNANAGIADGEFGRAAGMTSFYSQIHIVDEPLVEFGFCAFSKNKNITLSDWSDLSEYNIAFISGWKTLEENVITAKSIHTVTNEESLFAMLQADRVDLILYNCRRGKYYLKNNNIKDIYPLEPRLADRKMYLYLHKSQMQLIPQLEQVLRGMKDDGTFARTEVAAFE